MKKLLIANRAEIACRIARAAKSLGIATVAVYTDVDADAPHVAQCDEAVCIGAEGKGKSPYLHIRGLLLAAEQTGADAIHPGYGFLAERADFAREVVDAGLIWVGPPATVMDRLGRKDGAKVLARSIGVPVVPGIELVDTDLPENQQERVAEVGFPLLIKAVAGGGGRGMRVVRDPGALVESLQLATREASEAFGDGTLLIERYIERGRHVEIQILADAHGTVLHLGERECSVQRRHQKLLEESPSPAVSPDLRAQMTAAAVKLAAAVGYVSAGTVEFLLDDVTGQFYFLEVNTRIQVEHPVTELVTGLDLVGWQLQIARGVPLTMRQDEVIQTGHAIEARLCAEDPQANFAPQTGAVLRWQPPMGEGVRVDHGLNARDAVSVHYDAMIAKILAWGPDRPTAIARLVRALKQTELLGLRSNIAHLLQVLQEPDFVAGNFTTRYIESHPVAADPPVPDEALLAVALWRHAPALVGRFRNNPARPDVTVLILPEGQTVHLALQHKASRLFYWGASHTPDPLLATPLPSQTPVEWLASDANSVTFATRERRQTWRIASEGKRLWLHAPDGVVCAVDEGSLLPEPKPPEAAAGSVVAQIAAVVSHVHVKVGDTVAADQPLVTLESMKMLTILKAPQAGVVLALFAGVGESVASGAVLVEIGEA
jgi:acetyl/propionyl-CoA carboxylase alpha subunit